MSRWALIDNCDGKHRMKTRRAFVRGGLATAAMLAASRQETLAKIGGLRDLAATHNLTYGCATSSGLLVNDTAFGRAVRTECGMLVPEWEMKWDPSEPSPGRFDFGGADGIVNFAREARMSVRGHNLVWHNAMPRWLRAALAHSDRRTATQLMVEHIRAVVGYYRGRLTSWDVVNEAIRPQDGLQSDLRNTPWFRAIGAGYLELAYRLAHEADRRTPLVYNDLGLEYALADHDRRRRAVLRLLEGFRKRGVPCAALGVQAHLFAKKVPFDAKRLSKFLSEVADLNYQILITELDVNDDPKTGSIYQRDRAIAEEAERFLDVALAQKRVTTLLTWGLSDRYTWWHSRSNENENLFARPLPLDANLNRKPLWFAIARAIRNAPARPTIVSTGR
jgi:endo-1,4-beta-xylanase